MAGVDEAKDELEEVVDFLKDPERYGRLGGADAQGRAAGRAARHRQDPAGARRRRRGGRAVLLDHRLGIRRDVRRRRRGARARSVRAGAPEGARIIFIDELDALGRARGAYPCGGGHDEKEQTLNQLLVELDGFDLAHRPGAAWPRPTGPEILDPALLRAGRFDRQVLVDRPDKARPRARS